LTLGHCFWHVIFPFMLFEKSYVMKIDIIFIKRNNFVNKNILA
jgi:hypothetical protein